MKRPHLVHVRGSINAYLYEASLHYIEPPMNTHTPSTPRVQKHVRVSVRRKDSKKHTTVSLSPREMSQALSYVGDCRKRVFNTVRNIAKTIDTGDFLPGDFSMVVRRKALARLRGGVRNPSVQLAAENNDSWGDECVQSNRTPWSA